MSKRRFPPPPIIIPPPPMPPIFLPPQAPVLQPPTLIINAEKPSDGTCKCELPTAEEIANAVRRISTPETFFTPTRDIQRLNGGLHPTGDSSYSVTTQITETSSSYIWLFIVVILILLVVIGLIIYFNTANETKKKEDVVDELTVADI